MGSRKPPLRRLSRGPQFHSLPRFPLHLLPGPLSHAAVCPSPADAPFCPPCPQLSPPASLHTLSHIAASSAATPRAKTVSLIIYIFISHITGHCAALPEDSHLGDLPVTVGSFYCYYYPTCKLKKRLKRAQVCLCKQLPTVLALNFKKKNKQQNNRATFERARCEPGSCTR